MAEEDQVEAYLLEKEHQSSYVFDPNEEVDASTNRPSKRRKVTKRSNKSESSVPRAHIAKVPAFPSLMDGTESQGSIGLRQQLFESSWSQINRRVQLLLREANQSTLDEVTSFVRAAPSEAPEGKIASAFIMTGPNIASQDLLFEQLAETLQADESAKVVRLRSGDASNLKATLKKIIQDVLSQGSEDEEDHLGLSSGKDNRKYLNYDLEALYHHCQSTNERVIIAFQDSEAFDGGVLADLIDLLSSWLDRIPFTVLFGVATSLELFQARLLKSTCQRLYGDQFDVEQTASVVNKVFNASVAHSDSPIRLGPSLVRALLERQRDQVTSISVFVSSLKYAYMCHFYANPLTAFLCNANSEVGISPEQLAALRLIPSFRRVIEDSVKEGDLKLASELLNDDEHLQRFAEDQCQQRHKWVVKLLQVVKISQICIGSTDFVELYIDALSNGLDAADRNADLVDTVRRMAPAETIQFLEQLLGVMKQGDATLGLDEWATEADEAVSLMNGIVAEVVRLRDEAQEQGHTLRSKYSGQSKVVRTTVIAQKVQLSRDTASLTEADTLFTELMDRITGYLEETLRIEPADELPFHELWMYDAKAPYKDVFVPRPRVVVERALSRPHDYLACACCQAEEGQVMPTLPPTAVLYQLYLETGSLVNVADLWSAYCAMVGGSDDDASPGGLDERTALVLFYRGLAELRAMGFVKPSRKKADHIAKLAWKGL